MSNSLRQKIDMTFPILPTGLTHKLTGLLPVRQRAKLYQWLKSRRQRRALSSSGVVIISYPKSGRTWFRIMLSRCYAGTYALDENILIKGDNFHRLDARIPNVTSFHGKFINDIAAGQDAHQILEGKKVIFLVRNPIDVSISCYFHLFGGRSRPQKREMQGIPKSMDELPIDQFVISSKWSVENIIKFMNEWGLVLEKNPNMLLLKYEDMRASPAFEMGRVNTFLGGPFTSDVIDTAVSASSFDKLKEQERSGTIANSALQPRDKDDPNSYKVRRGKVGGYVDYLSPETIVEVENTATQELSPAFGYIPGNGAGDAA